MRRVAEFSVGQIGEIRVVKAVDLSAQQLIDPAVAGAVQITRGVVGRHAAGARDFAVAIQRAYLVGIDRIILGVILAGVGQVGGILAQHLELIGFIQILAVYAVGGSCAFPGDNIPSDCGRGSGRGEIGISLGFEHDLILRFLLCRLYRCLILGGVIIVYRCA